MELKKLLTVEEIREKLVDRNLKKTSAKANVNYKSLLFLFNGKINNPDYETVKKLSFYFQKENQSE